MADTLSLKDELFPVDAPPEGYPAGAAALDAVVRTLKRFVYFSRGEEYDAVALWIAHCYVFRAFRYTPRLAFTSDGPGCGKSLALEITGLMVPDLLRSAGMSAASLRIAIEKRRPVVALDEADILFGVTGRKNEDARAILNAGYEVNGIFITAASNGSDIREWHVFAPVVFAGIGKLPPTLEDRSIAVKMQKPPASRRPERYREKLHEDLVAGTGKTAGEWVRSVAPELGDEIPEAIEGVELRSESIWEGLLCIGILAGGDWPDRARAACSALVTGSGSPESVSVPPDIQVLMDIRTVFRGDRMPSSALVRALMELDGAQWADTWNEATAPSQLAGMLRQWGITPRIMRIQGDRAKRSYARADFADAWAMMMSHAR